MGTEMETRTIPPDAEGDAFLRALQTFPWARVTVTCVLPQGFDTSEDLPDRLRGAMGARLSEQPSNSDAALLHQLIVDDQDMGEDITRPFTIQCNDLAGRVEIRVHLAGMAANMMVVTGFALRAALAGGVRMGRNNRRRVGLECSPPVFERRMGFETRSTTRPDRLHLRLTTPLSLRRGARGIAGSIDTLPLNIEQRFRRLAADWHFPVEVPSRIPPRLSWSGALEESGLGATTYEHWSRFRTEPARVPAVRGTALLYGNCRPFLPLLAFAEVFHAGSSTAFGLGRIEYSAT